MKGFRVLIDCPNGSMFDLELDEEDAEALLFEFSREIIRGKRIHEVVNDVDGLVGTMVKRQEG